jgi:hypothetical protein
MEFETYADVIDSYEISSDKLKGISLTDYIKNNNIRIKEIDMDPMGDLENILKGSKPMEKEGVMQLASAKKIDPRVTMEAIVEEFIRKKGRRPRSIDELKEFYFMETGSAKGRDKSEEMLMASYEPGKYSDDEIEMYEQYKYDMNEQMPGFPIMEIDDFLRMEYGQGRAGVQAGGLPGILGV